MLGTGHTAPKNDTGQHVGRAHGQPRMLVGGPGYDSNGHEPMIGKLGECQASMTVQEMKLPNKSWKIKARSPEGTV